MEIRQELTLVYRCPDQRSSATLSYEQIHNGDLEDKLDFQRRLLQN